MPALAGSTLDAAFGPLSAGAFRTALGVFCVGQTFFGDTQQVYKVDGNTLVAHATSVDGVGAHIAHICPINDSLYMVYLNPIIADYYYTSVDLVTYTMVTPDVLVNPNMFVRVGNRVVSVERASSNVLDLYSSTNGVNWTLDYSIDPGLGTLQLNKAAFVVGSKLYVLMYKDGDTAFALYSIDNYGVSSPALEFAGDLTYSTAAVGQAGDGYFTNGGFLYVPLGSTGGGSADTQVLTNASGSWVLSSPYAGAFPAGVPGSYTHTDGTTTYITGLNPGTFDLASIAITNAAPLVAEAVTITWPAAPTSGVVGIAGTSAILLGIDVGTFGVLTGIADNAFTVPDVYPEEPTFTSSQGNPFLPTYDRDPGFAVILRPGPINRMMNGNLPRIRDALEKLVDKASAADSNPQILVDLNTHRLLNVATSAEDNAIARQA